MHNLDTSTLRWIVDEEGDLFSLGTDGTEVFLVARTESDAKQIFEYIAARLDILYSPRHDYKSFDGSNIKSWRGTESKTIHESSNTSTT
jgi:hypothetical protein